jgi:hypothetical protein
MRLIGLAVILVAADDARLGHNKDDRIDTPIEV